MNHRGFAWIGLSALVVACASPEEAGGSGAGSPCKKDSDCAGGLLCQAEVCTAPDAGIDASSGGSGAIGGSGGSSGTTGGSSATGGASGGAGSDGGSGVSGGGGSGGASGSGGTTASGGANSGGGSSGSGGATDSGVGGSGGSAGSGGVAGSGGATGAPSPPTNPQGCATCSCCDPWIVTWAASSGASYYNVIWKCSIFPQHVINVGNVTKADLCSTTVGMCDSSQCANGTGLLQVQACNATACSAPVSFTGGTPIACGGGCCC